ncbi:MAG: membrane dipeptidase [Anaerolineales bacterium]|jgi:membrane dipeptidase
MIVDAHEDLAWNMLTFGRDYRRSVAETRALEAGGPTPKRNGDTLLGGPDWLQGGVGVVFGTLFASPARLTLEGWDKLVFDDEATAHHVYRQQIDAYQEMVESSPEAFLSIRSLTDLEGHLQAWPETLPDKRSVGFVTLMEGADGIQNPDEVELWWELGVRAIGLVWMGANQYAGGTKEPGPLTQAGKRLLDAMAELGFILDVSHLPNEAALGAIERYPGSVIASHSNPRALLGHARFPERHLTDDALRALLARDAVIGTVLGNTFLKDGWTKGDPRDQVNVAHVVAHIDYVCQMAGDARHAGLGSDFDGGFGLGQVPIDFESVADLGKIGDALAEHGYAPSDVEAVMGGNWIRMLQTSLPDS